MPTYWITWEIEVDADTPREAAQEALDVQRDEFSTATVFLVTDANGNKEYIDLEEVEE